MIVADTGAVIALLDADDRHHPTLVALWEADPAAWMIPWAVLPEVDHIARSRLGASVARAFRADVAEGAFQVDFGAPGDLVRAHELCDRYRDLDIGLVDAVVMAVAERLGAAAIATLDLRDFAGIELRGRPRILPRDL